MPLHPTLSLSPEDASHLLNSGLVGVDVHQMQRAGLNRPRVLDLIRTGRLKYLRRDPHEHWQTYDELMGAVKAEGVGTGDCEDLAGLLPKLTTRPSSVG